MTALEKRNLTSLSTVLVLFMAGCAALDRAKLADRAQQELIGATKDHLLACTGAPDKQITSGDREYLTYIVHTKMGTVKGTGGGSRFCEATFVVKGNHIESITYRGKTGGLLSKGEQCGYIVQNCLN